MNPLYSAKCLFRFILLFSTICPLKAQTTQKPPNQEKTAAPDSSYPYYYRSEHNTIVCQNIPSLKITPVFVPDSFPRFSLKIQWCRPFDQHKKLLIFANAKKVWREKTIGDYFIYDTASHHLIHLGKKFPPQSLQFAQVSPDKKSVAYVCQNNVYIENLNTGQIQAITRNGSPQIANGTFDWSYEEEFGLRDGIRWSTDGRFLAYWSVHSKNIPDFLMLNNTDSAYPFIQTLPYPKVGFPIAQAQIHYYDVLTKKHAAFTLPKLPREYFITQLAPHPKRGRFIFQLLDRKQQNAKIYVFNCLTGKSNLLYKEVSDTWIERINLDKQLHQKPGKWFFTDKEGSFLWLSEKNKHQQICLIKDNTQQRFITPDTYDVLEMLHIDTLNKEVYFIATLKKATDRYLYKINYQHPSTLPIPLTPDYFEGINSYQLIGDRYARHHFSNYYTPAFSELITLDQHIVLDSPTKDRKAYIDSLKNTPSNIQYLPINLPNGIVLDAWMHLPANFDPHKKYPVLFHVYGEPASQTTLNRYGVARLSLYKDTTQPFIYVTLDQRGSPAPKGKAWRKAIYEQLGTVNVKDQAEGIQYFLEQHPFADKDRVGVWGWSGGGSVTLHLLFQYPRLFKMGISIAPLTDLKTYDNIYEERYMGALKTQEDTLKYQRASPVHYAERLKADLLLIHGTGDDNVHYQNAELLINALIKHKKIFYFMSYPNRSHSISEKENTPEHLKIIFTNFVRKFLINP